jgi:hypothetical protein
MLFVGCQSGKRPGLRKLQVALGRLLSFKSVFILTQKKKILRKLHFQKIPETKKFDYNYLMIILMKF